MCGIIGAIGVHSSLSSDIALNLISHRGPDSSGVFIRDKFFIGHTRLSIQDLSENGSQPMYSEDKRYVIIFNGEISISVPSRILIFLMSYTDVAII